MNTAKKAALVMAVAGLAAGAASGSAFAHGGAGAEGAAVGSPGVGSGNVVQVPIDVPINAVGNTVDVIGLLNPAFGNSGRIG
ncbi:chaplin [Streptomyces sp. NPDC051956]|uniref:chaplin n=1 Tax=Streptomyces sp. NPDC051956 TaxID=3365677 RepID=UPI0037D486D0